MTTSTKLCAWAGLAVALFFAFRPGVTGPDTFDIAWRGNIGQYHDWHPIVAMIYSGLTYPVFGFPDNFLVAQSIFGAAAIIQIVLVFCTRTTMTLRPSYVGTALCAGYSILIIAICTSFAVKDMWIALLLTNSALLITKPDKWRALLSVLLIMCAAMMRPTVLLPALPLIVATAWPIGKTPLRRIGIAIVLTIAVGVSPFLLTMATKAETRYPDTPTLVFDIVGIGMRQPDRVDFIAEHLGKRYTEEQLVHCFTPKTSDPFFWSTECGEQHAAHHAQIFRAWVSAIVHHPIDYMKHRLDHIKELFAPVDVDMGAFTVRTTFPLDGTNSTQWMVPGYDKLRISLLNEPRALLDALTKAHRAIGAWTTLDNPWTWHFMAIGICGAAFFFRSTVATASTNAAMAASLSSLLYSASFAIFGSSAEVRYLIWTLVGVSIAATILLLGMIEQRQALPLYPPETGFR